MRKKVIVAFVFVLILALGASGFFAYWLNHRESEATKAAKESDETEREGTGKSDPADMAASEAIEEDPQQARPLVGILLPGKPRDEEWVYDRQVLLDELTRDGYSFRTMYARGNVELQESQFQRLMDSGCKALILAPVDRTQLKGSLAQANEANIGIFSYKQLLMDTPDIDYYLTFDTRAAGQQVGEAILKSLGLPAQTEETGVSPLPFTVEFAMRDAGDDAELFFFNGVMESLQESLSLDELICPSGRTRFKEAVLEGSFEEILRDHYTGRRLPDVIVTGHYEVALEIAELLKEKGYSSSSMNWPLIATLGADEDLIRALDEGSVSYCAFLDERELARSCVSTVDTYLHGETPEVSNYGQYDNGVRIVRAVTVPSLLIDRDNYRLVFDTGYFSEEEVFPGRVIISPLLEGSTQETTSR